MCEKKPVFKVGQVVKTRDGRDARVICVDAKRERSIVALILDDSCEHETWQDYTEDGGCGTASCHGCDLMPPMRTVWLNFYENYHKGICVDGVHHSQEAALRFSGQDKRYIEIAIPVEIPA